MRALKKTEHPEIYILLGISILLGIYLRASLVMRADFPLNDGGLFWTMTQDLIQNHFVLPPSTTYNLASLPYAYPPGAFYLNGWLSQGLHIPLTDLFRYMPLFFCILGLFLVYPIALIVLNSPRMALMASFAFASLQPSFGWLIMGGGVTRSPAIFFSMLAIFATLKAAKARRNLPFLLLSAVSMTLSAYFHLEITWVSALVLVLIYAYYDHSRRIWTFFATHLLVGALLLSPYFVTVGIVHGVQPFFNAFSSGHRDFSSSLGLLLVPNYTAELIFPIMAVAGVLGVLASLASRQYLPIFWLLLITLINPRSVHRSAALPEVLLIAAGLETALFRGVASWLSPSSLTVPPHPKSALSLAKLHFPFFGAALLILYAFLLTFVGQSYLYPARVLSVDERAAFTWVSNHTSPDAVFLTLPAAISWEIDWIAEWFPTLTNRQDVLTVQGYEWVDGLFDQRMQVYADLMGCENQVPECVPAWKKKNNLAYDYILWPKRSEKFTPAQMRLLKITDGCALEFQNPDVEIYHCSP